MSTNVLSLPEACCPYGIRDSFALETHRSVRFWPTCLLVSILMLDAFQHYADHRVVFEYLRR